MSLIFDLLDVSSFTATAVLPIITIVFASYLWRKRPSNSPPGSNGIPLLGVAPWLGRKPERTLAKWSKIYGPIYMVKVGSSNMVVISSPEILYEAFAKRDCLNDRPQTISALQGGNGILLLNKTDFYKEQRRFGLHTLREFGMGRRSLEPMLIEVSKDFCDKINGLCGKGGKSKPFDISSMTYDLISSVICCMVFGHAVNKDNEEFRKVIKMLTSNDRLAFLNALLMLVPVLKHFPVFSYVSQRGVEFQKSLHDAIKIELKLHQSSRDKNNPRDFIDSFLNEMDQPSNGGTKIEELCASQNGISRKVSNNDDEEGDFSSDWVPGSSFQEEQLVGTVRDLFIGGTDTTSTSILWVVLFLTKYSDIQKKMQAEIDSVLGESGIPQMARREKLPYVQAVIEEVSRVRPAAPLAIPHVASRDAELAGYRIPKGTLVVSNLWAIHHDEKRWPQAERFIPERHIDKQGKFSRSNDWVLFGVGRRSCLGQQLAKMEVFIATVCLFQRFNFCFPQGHVPKMDGHSIVNLRPDFFSVIAIRR